MTVLINQFFHNFSEECTHLSVINNTVNDLGVSKRPIENIDVISNNNKSFPFISTVQINQTLIANKAHLKKVIFNINYKSYLEQMIFYYCFILHYYDQDKRPVEHNLTISETRKSDVLQFPRGNLKSIRPNPH